MNTKLLYLFIKDTTYYTNSYFSHTHQLPISIYLMDKFFRKTFFLFFKKINTKNFGIMTINLTKSLLYKTLSDVDNLVLSKNLLMPDSNYTLTLHNVKYLQPVTIISFAFQKKTYDTLMIYIFFLLVDNYTSAQNAFKLNYGFILLPHNFLLYPFLNLFYFKLRQF